MSLFLWGLIHIAVSSLVSLSLALIYGHLTPTISGIALFIGAIVPFWGVHAFKGQTSPFRVFYFNDGFDRWLEGFLFLFLSFVSVYHFHYIFYLDGSFWKTLNIYNLGDLPLHINYIRAMSLGNDFPLLNPLFPSQLLRYPYGIDLYNALWDSLGVSISSHLFWVGVFGCIASLVALKGVASWWGMTGFFLSGGLLGWYGYGAEMADKLEWKNLFLSVLVTQRGFLYALPVGLFLLKMMMDKKSKIPPLWFGFLWGTLGFFHLHSFFILSLMMGAFALINGKLRPALKALCIAVPLGGIFVLFSTDFFRKKGLTHFKWGWTYKGPESFWSFLTFNFGVYLFLFAILGVLIFWNSWKDKKARELLGPFILFAVSFAIFFNVIMSPWTWDSVKVLLWPYLGLLTVASLYWQKRLSWKVKALVFAACAYSGLTMLVPTLTSHKNAPALYSQTQIENSYEATKDLPRSAIFLAPASHDQVLGYWGRIRFLGYMGHLWSHGIRYDQEWLLYDRFTKSDPEWKQIFTEMKIDYVYYGPDMAELFRHQPQAWQSELKNVSPLSEPSVYQVK